MARWLAIGAAVILGARAVVDGLRLRLELRYLGLFERSFREPRQVARAMAETESALGGLERVADGLLAAAALSFAGWLWLRYRELGERRRDPTWALWSWLVPGLNLVEPYRIVREVHGGEPLNERAPWLLFGWWTSWLLYLVTLLGALAAESRASRYLRAGEPLLAFEQSLLAVRFGVGIAAASMVAALLGAGVVIATERRVSARG